MDENSLLISLVFLIGLSSFFSGSETAIMSLNHFRLNHLRRKEHKGAVRLLQLIERPDRLLGVILFGNTTTNIVASSVATAWALHAFGDSGPLIASLALTFIILVFAEMTPKTMAALHPETFAFRVSWVMTILMKVFSPVVWFLSGISNTLLRICRVPVGKKELPRLSRDELRSIVMEIGDHEHIDYRTMLLRLIDSESVTVDDVMVPKGEIEAINIDDSVDEMIRTMQSTLFQNLPIFQGQLNHIIGVVNIRELFQKDLIKDLTPELMMKQAEPAYFIPEGTSIIRQASQFRDMGRQIGFVVDEYGDLQGLVALNDIVEEIVGEFSDSLADTLKMIRHQDDGSVILDAGISIRILNREMGCELEAEDSKTLNGLIVEALDGVPEYPVCLCIQGMRLEILAIANHCVREVKLYPDH